MTFSIRKEQIAVFEQAGSPEFALRMEEHILEAFPKHSDFLGREGIREIVCYGVEQGRGLRFVTQSSVCLFIDLTLLLGREFYNDPQLLWAREIIEDDELFPGELSRAQRLHAMAIEYLDSVSGPDNEFIDEAQKRISSEELTISTGSRDLFIREISVRLERIWPEKFNNLNETARMELIRLGVQKAIAYNIGSEPGALFCIGMMFMLGSGFDKDPMFRWSHEILVSAEAIGEKIARLHAAGIAYLNQWCAGGECHV
jgi:hypothetical protein